MVGEVNRAGLFDWLIQRCTAVIVGLYTIFIVIYCLNHPALDYMEWEGLFANTWVRVATIIALASILWHAWIGLWTVFTDYVKVKPVRLFLEIMVMILLIAYFIWLLEILWH